MNISDLSQEQVQALQIAMTPKLNKFIPIQPTVKQTAALLMNNIYEMLYGGAAGGGKSVFILAAALQYMDVPGYSAILFRKTFADLMLPSALIPLSQQWLAPFLADGSVRWYDKDKKYVFNEYGSTLNFGYLDAKDDHLRYQGAEFQFIGFDEVTHINPAQYRYLHSRLRRKKGMNAPLRIRATANPGGTYGDYYYQRFFVDIDTVNEGLDIPKRVFLASGLKDNPHLDAEEYRRSLSELDDVTRAQLENGDWEIREKGDVFDTGWFIMIDPQLIPTSRRMVRYWDLASIDPKLAQRKGHSKTDPDWTVGLKMSFDGLNYYIEDIIRVQRKPGDVMDLIGDVAAADTSSCAIRMEEEGGSSGKFTTQAYAKHLAGYNYAGIPSVSSKVERARPFAAAAQRGNVFISKRCRYITELFSELEAFPNGAHDDLVDGCSGAFNSFSQGYKIAAPNTAVTRAAMLAKKQAATEESTADRFNSLPIAGSYWHTNMSNRRF